MSNSNEIKPTRYYQLIGDVYEYHGPKTKKGQPGRSKTSPNLHTDSGFRLREKGLYGSFQMPLADSLEDRPCPKVLNQKGLYQLLDADGEVYFGMSTTNIHDRIWKYGPKMLGLEATGVKDTVNFSAWCKERKGRGYTNLNDIQVRFFYMPNATATEIDNEETYCLGMLTALKGFPKCNGVKKYKINPNWFK